MPAEGETLSLVVARTWRLPQGGTPYAHPVPRPIFVNLLEPAAARYLSISSARCSQDKNKKRAGRTCDGVVFHWCKELFYNTRVAEEKILLLKVHFARDAFSQKVNSLGLLLKKDGFNR